MQRNLVLWALAAAMFWIRILVGAEEETDPITDTMRYELAAAQRDFLIAQQQFEKANVQLRTKMDAAQKACAAEEQVFAIETFHCAHK